MNNPKGEGLFVGPSDECQICIDWDHPCDNCAREIHQSWHSEGFWWIRLEACDRTCPEFEDTVEKFLLPIIELTPRDKAREKQLRLNA